MITFYVINTVESHPGFVGKLQVNLVFWLNLLFGRNSGPKCFARLPLCMGHGKGKGRVIIT